MSRVEYRQRLQAGATILNNRWVGRVMALTVAATVALMGWTNSRAFLYQAMRSILGYGEVRGRQQMHWRVY